MDLNSIRLREEIAVYNHTFEVLQAQNLIELIKLGKIENQEFVNYRKLITGHFIKITDKISPEINQIVNSVIKKLHYRKLIECYIVNDSIINAFSISLELFNQPNVVVLSSQLLNTFNDEELKFVLGHEIGHLIIGSRKLAQVRNFLFNDDKGNPIDDKHLSLMHELGYLDNLIELSADRFGLSACENVDSCISAFIKMYSGLDTDNRKLNIANLLQQSANLLSQNETSASFINHSHPIYPIRIQAIKFFNESKFYAEYKIGRIIEDIQLKEKMDSLCTKLRSFEITTISRFLPYFIASAGLLVADLDGEITEKEIDLILRYLSSFVLFPESIIEEIKDEDYLEVFEKSLTTVLNENPEMAEDLFVTIIDFSLADGFLHQNEKDFIFDIGEEVFKYKKEEIALILAFKIKEIYRKK